MTQLELNLGVTNAMVDSVLRMAFKAAAVETLAVAACQSRHVPGPAPHGAAQPARSRGASLAVRFQELRDTFTDEERYGELPERVNAQTGFVDE